MPRHFFTALITLSLSALFFGCAQEVGTEASSGAFLPIAGDAGVECARPEEGCACNPGQHAIDCYLDPLVGGGGAPICQRGTRYCRGRTWTTCENVQSYSFQSAPGVAALLGDATECNPCDPACAVSRTTPDDSDLVGHSVDVTYDGTSGGVRLSSGPPMPPPPLEDADGDGIPNVADECVGPGAFAMADGTCYGDTFLYHELPFGGPTVVDPIEIGVQIRTADIYFLMDTTGSMGGELSRLQSDLTTGSFLPGCGDGIIGAIQCTIPDAWFGVGAFDDYPYGSYGSGAYGDVVYANSRNIGGDLVAAQAAVNSLALHYGVDGPESNAQALWAIATGGGLGTYLPAQTSCPAGTWGYPCFRDGAIPIVVMFTDAPFHNGPNGYDYNFTGTVPTLVPPSTTTAVRDGSNDVQNRAERVRDVDTTWQQFTGNTRGSTDDYGSTCMGAYSGTDVVYRFDVGVQAQVTMDVEMLSGFPALSLRDSSFNEIQCHFDWTRRNHATIEPVLNPGTYYLVIRSVLLTEMVYSLNIGQAQWSTGTPPPTDYPISWADTTAALQARDMRVITVHSGGGYGRGDADALADVTLSLSSSGARYVFPIPTDGSGLSGAVVDAVVDLANYSRMDIAARVVDDPGTPFDETTLVSTITATGWGPGSCTGISGGSVFTQCLPGTSVDFSVAFQNSVVMPSAVAQVFTFFIEVVGDGSFVLERIPVRIVVPPAVGVYPGEGSYYRDFDSTAYCGATERPDWSDLSWEIPDLPAGTSVRWELQTANTAAELDSAPVVSFTTPSATSPEDVAARLVGAGEVNFLPFLRVRAVLVSDPTLTLTPTLRSFDLRFTCVPIE